MADTNQYGLSRYISVEVREQVRRRCGFGCVICGAAFCDFEHFAPDFKDAREHRAEGITLLCMQHNQRRARGTLSVETVIAANAAPFCLQAGFASETFDFGADWMQIVVGSCIFNNMDVLIQINRSPILSIQRPLAPGQPFRLTGRFTDARGDDTLRIEDNISQFLGKTGMWSAKARE